MQKIMNGFWFQPRKIYSFLTAAAGILALSGCFSEDVAQKKQPGQADVVVSKVSFRSLSGWNAENFGEVIPVFRKNCEAILKNKNEFIYSSQIKIKTKDYQRVCEKFLRSGITTGVQFKRFAESEFVPYVVADGKNTDGQFTSYYEATIRASFEKSDKYKYPIYGKPLDLVEVKLKDFDENLPDTRLVGRVEGNKFIPYYKRKEIEQNGVKAPVLMWGDDLIDIHFMQIQGSAVAKLNDGSELRIGFADSNGRKFKGIGKILLEKGVLKPGEASMPKIREWLRNNPHRAESELAENERFIFQRLVDSDGPVGALGLSLTAGRSMAVDNSFVPLGAMMWLDTENPDKEPIQKIVFAQDIGSAIKGVVRGDYFWGHGEEALQEAGRMNSKGRYYILAPRYSALKVN